VGAVPAEISGVGSTQQKLRVSPGFDPMKAQVGPDEYFLLSRIDGVQPLRDVMLATGLPVERAVAIVMKLRSIGALLLPGETAPPKAAPAPAPTPPPKPAQPQLDTSLPDPTADELAALSEDNVLDGPTRRRILALGRLVAKHDPWLLLGVPQGSNHQALKRAYFKLSKDIHPDRFYGKQLGSFGERLSTVFEAASRAYERLTSPDPRVSGTHRAVTPDQPQSPQEYAAELFDRAIGLEVSGDALEAMKLFAAAIRLDSQTKYLRRAASCALAANQPRTALEYAKKAQAASPSDPSLARLLAIAFKATGKLADAEEVLVMAMALKSENDALGAELRSELAEVRRLLGGS